MAYIDKYKTSVIKDIGTGPIGTDIGPTTQNTAAVRAHITNLNTRFLSALISADITKISFYIFGKPFY